MNYIDLSMLNYDDVIESFDKTSSQHQRALTCAKHIVDFYCLRFSSVKAASYLVELELWVLVLVGSLRVQQFVSLQRIHVLVVRVLRPGDCQVNSEKTNKQYQTFERHFEQLFSTAV